ITTTTSYTLAQKESSTTSTSEALAQIEDAENPTTGSKTVLIIPVLFIAGVVITLCGKGRKNE
ncbi:MAG TPA: hypothetical protein VJX95_03360, partial [Oscillospiraceae bacterium]|nr:hypothetical protein [Oscillospiraceae bacterium]